MLTGIMNTAVGHAGQPGYVVKGGDEVILQPATNLPGGSKIDYFAALDDGAENYIGIGEDDVRVIVDWDEIEGKLEYDDGFCDAPWNDCEGWEHESRELGYWDHDDVTESRGYARCDRNPNVLIEIDDDVIINQWGHTRLNGESKQVHLERVARVKRSALDQLVKWYEDGWSYHFACAEYGDYQDSCGGILSDDSMASDKYCDDIVEECRHEVASQLENDGYIVENRPARESWTYNPVNSFKEKIKRNLDQS